MPGGNVTSFHKNATTQQLLASREHMFYDSERGVIRDGTRLLLPPFIRGLPVFPGSESFCEGNAGKEIVQAAKGKRSEQAFRQPFNHHPQPQ